MLKAFLLYRLFLLCKVSTEVFLSDSLRVVVGNGNPLVVMVEISNEDGRNMFEKY